MALDQLSTPSLAALYLAGRQQSQAAHEVLRLGPAEYFRRLVAISEGSLADADQLQYQPGTETLVETHERDLARPFPIRRLRESITYDNERWPINRVEEAFGWANQANKSGRGLDRAVQWLKGMTGALDSHLEVVESALKARLGEPATRSVAQANLTEGASPELLQDLARGLLVAEASQRVEASRIRSSGPHLTL